MNQSKNIKQLRIKAGLSQQELAKLIGVPYQNIYRWENGIVSPSLKTVAKIAQALQVSTDAIIFSKKDKVKLQTSNKALAKRIKSIEQLRYSDQQALFKIIDVFLKSKNKRKTA